MDDLVVGSGVVSGASLSPATDTLACPRESAGLREEGQPDAGSCPSAGCLAERIRASPAIALAVGRNQRTRIGPVRQLPRLDGAAQPVAPDAAERGRSADSRRGRPQRGGHSPAEAHDERLELVVPNYGHTERGRGPMNVRGPER